MGRFRIVLCILIGAVFAAYVVETARAQAGIEVITAAQVRLRAGPGPRFDTITTIPAGTTLTAFARSDQADWVKVSYTGQSGWLAVAYLRFRGNLFTLPAGDVAPPNQGDPATPAPVQNGDVVTLERYGQTDRVDYYRLVYMSDGLRITGFYAEPRTFGKFPAVIYNRGGNRNTGTLYGFEFAALAEAGFVVAASQYRGAAGSEGFEQFGGDDVNDVLNLVPLLQRREKVDPDKIGIFGSSRGAMMTYIAVRRGGPFKAAATTSGVADLFMWAKERRDLDRGFYPGIIGGNSVTAPGALRERSATYWANEINVPLLLVHGDADTEVSLKQSQALYDKMVAAGKTVKLVIMPSGNHGLLNYEYGMAEVLKWFAIYIGKPGENYDYNFLREAIFNAYRKLDPRRQ